VFQAEDGIRDRNVTGVQTCALPIYFCLSLYDILDFFLFNLISELFTLGLGLKYFFGSILNIEISTSAIISYANEHFVFNILLEYHYFTFKLLSYAIISKNNTMIIYVLN